MPCAVAFRDSTRAFALAATRRFKVSVFWRWFVPTRMFCSRAVERLMLDDEADRGVSRPPSSETDIAGAAMDVIGMEDS